MIIKDIMIQHIRLYYKQSMHSSAETSELADIFKGLDLLKVGYLTMQQFAAYIDQQPRKIHYYQLNELFNTLPDARMNQQAFICYVMGYRMNMEQLALARFAVEKQFSKHAAASPSSGANQIRKSGVKFSVASKKNLSADEKHHIRVSLGRDEKSQSIVYQQLEQILGRKPEDIVGVIKFKVSGAHEQIRHDLEQVLETGKGILSEMDEQLFRIIDLFKFSVKGYGNYIYILVEVGHVFLIDTVNFLNEFIQTLSPDALIELFAQLQSNYFKDFLKEGSEKKMEDLQVSLGLNIDNESLKKVKKIIGNQAQFTNPQQQLVGVIMLLLQQVNVQASFGNSQKVFNQLGVGSILSESKTSLGAIKEMQILQTVQGFVPENMIENIKKYGVGDGQISINLKNLYLRLQFNVEISGIFDLL